MSHAHQSHAASPGPTVAHEHLLAAAGERAPMRTIRTQPAAAAAASDGPAPRTIRPTPVPRQVAVPTWSPRLSELL